MKPVKTLLAFMVILSITVFAQDAKSQTAYKTMTTSQIKVLGTSNLHDWDMVADNFTCEGTFQVKGGVLQDITALQFSLPVTNLKSKESLMNTRAYKALNAETYKTITFKLTDATVVPNQKTVKVTGNLTISGVTQPVTLQSSYVVNADESLTFKGSKAIKMSSHKIKAPSFMMGALKTGDEVTIEFVLKLKK